MQVLVFSKSKLEQNIPICSAASGFVELQQGMNDIAMAVWNTSYGVFQPHHFRGVLLLK